MRLISVTIRGFRGYAEEQSLEVGDLTTIIGKNDVGKSTVLEALEIFFNNEVVKLDVGDLNVASKDKLVEVTCTFADFPERLILDAAAETSLADEFLLTSAGSLKVKKRWDCSGAKPKEEVYVTALHPSADRYSDLLSLSNAALKARLKLVGVDPSAVNQTSNPSMRSGIWGTAPQLDLFETDIPVAKEDMKKIWDKLSLHMPLFALFQSDRASRDSDSEVQDPMKLAVIAALAEVSVQEKLNDVIDAVRQHATELATRTHTALSKLDADLAKQLVPTFKAEPRWASLFSVALEGDDGIPINKRGSGVRRLILVSFFRAEADRKVAAGHKRNVIYAVEEPETSQHPRNQKILLESFRALADSEGCQVLLTTHSPGFASDLAVESLRFVAKDKGGMPRIHPGSEVVWAAIAEELGVLPDNRVKVIICVEGPTDVDALKSLSAALHLADKDVIDLAVDPRVAFVPLGGGNLKHWVNERYIKGLNRPEVHIYDNDVSSYSKYIEIVNARADGSWGALTSKREIENYVDAEAILDSMLVVVPVDDNEDLPKLISTALSNSLELTSLGTTNVKKVLAKKAFPLMTAERIGLRDPAGEVAGWLTRIRALAEE
ncbi:DUF2813 domain-containing protein [Cryobacterium sp. TmT2-59]|nr:DUF2813 domain-containing protein [Cryobacterium sp. TmT2-59]